MSRTILGRIAVLAVIVIAGTVILLPRLQLSNYSEKNEYVSDNKAVRPSSSGGGSATSGRLFSGDKIRSYSKRHFGASDEISREPTVFQVPTEEVKCARWSVVTTIFEPSSAVKKQAKIDGWCLVVVGDRKGPLAYDIEASNNTFVFLTASMQKEMSEKFPLVKALPWNHFGRKNIGYLYAILHGATTVWDFDDDNMLLTDEGTFEILPPSDRNTAVILEAVDYASDKKLSFNPYPLMACETSPCWPRGLPLQDIKFNHSSVVLRSTEIPLKSIGIIQSLANHDPDVDAIYRLTQPLPFSFKAGKQMVAVPTGSYAPYNAQATLHFYSALWSLMLPVTVHGRVSDIWRGYAAQRILSLLDLRLVFSPPLVRQDRNVHNYMADFDSENDLYIRSNRLLEQLKAWEPSTSALSSLHPLCACIEEMWVMMYEVGYIEIGDIDLIRAWLTSLLSAGYLFPVPFKAGNTASLTP